MQYYLLIVAKISIHAPREGSDADQKTMLNKRLGISIHALREGSDRANLVGGDETADISIHAPREGSDHRVRPGGPAEIFQSTLPVRGATFFVPNRLTWQH